MSKKNKRRQGGQASAASVAGQVRRQLAKGDTRNALKDARVLYRRESNAAHRQLLAEACLARAENLHRTGMVRQAQETFHELLQLGPVAPEIEPRLARLRVLLGMSEGAAPSLADIDPSLAEQLSDQAVVHPTRVPAVYGDLLAEAARVRESLQAVERGDDPRAVELLQDIGRKSPLADWKLFVRGLSAHYAGELEQRDANWQRLNPQRAASRIAHVLLVHFGVRDAAAAGGDISLRLRRLDYSLVRDNSHCALKNMAVALRAERTSDAVRQFRSVVQQHAPSDASLVARVTDILWKHLVQIGDDIQLRTLASFAPPPALDPHWHRAEALLCEQHFGAASSPVERLWESYLADLPHVAELRDEEREIAHALTHVRLARAMKQKFDELEYGPYCDEPPSVPPVAQAKIIGHYQAALRHYPQLLDAHTELGEAYLEWDQPDQAAATHQMLLKHFPSRAESIEWLACHFLGKDQPVDAEPYITELQRLQPRAHRTQALLWNKRIALIRQAALRGHFDRARRELEEAARQPLHSTTWLTAIQVALELKAKRVEAAQQLIDQTLERLDNPAAFWMMLESYAVRYRLNRTWKKDFAARLQAALPAAPCSAAAGQMAEFLGSILAHDEKYTGRATHQRALRTYLTRCKKLDWEPGDLRYVCSYLGYDRHRSLPPSWLQHFTSVGIKKFPDDPHFPFYAGLAEMLYGPYHCDARSAVGFLEQALELNVRTATPLPPVLVERAKGMLTTLRDSPQYSLGPLPFFGWNRRGVEDEDGDEAESFASDMGTDDDPDDPSDDPPSRGFPAGPPRSLTKMLTELLDALKQISDLEAEADALDDEEAPEDGRQRGRSKQKRRRR